MPPSRRLESLEARGSHYPPVSLNTPVLGLLAVFALLLLICLGICCCSCMRAAKRNKHCQQRLCGVDRDLMSYTQLNPPLVSEESIERQEAPETKEASQSGFNQPPAYSIINPAMPPSPQLPESKSVGLLPPSPTSPTALSPPPPTYQAPHFEGSR
jgi:hypothetical protein